MALKERLFSHIILRNILADLGFRSAYSSEPGAFIPYFQYHIGPYKRDYHLYFPKEPFARRYKNEIFNKLFEYDRPDAKRYLAFHYDAYPDKGDFLRFLQDQITERLDRRPSKTQALKLQAALDWAMEKAAEYQTEQEKELRQNLRDIIDHQATASPEETDRQINALLEKLTPTVEKLISGYQTGNIRVTNQKYLQSIIQFFYVLQNVQHFDRNGKVKDRLFTSFTATDLAVLLRISLADFKEKQLNTIQKEIAKANETIKTDSDKFKRLDKALQEFFFE